MTTFILSVLAALIFLGVALWYLYGSANWLATEGLVLKAEIEEVYNQPGISSSSERHVFEYKVNLQYEYTFKGKKYVGTRLYPYLPNVFSNRKIADEAISQYKPGRHIKVFVDPNKPSKASLETSKSISPKGIAALIFIVLLVAAVLIVGVMVFNKNF